MSSPGNNRTGFTLIEVLVATAVMAIMVVMLGGFFQQASSSWDSGYVRAEGGMIVRAVVGSLTRDLATAIDGRVFGLSDPIRVNGTTVEFYRLKDGKGEGERDIEHVTYVGGGSVTRNGESIVPSQDPQSGHSFTAHFSFAKGEVPRALRTQTFRPYENTEFRNDVAWTVPFVKVRCELERTGTFSTGFGVRSKGNGKEILVH